MLVCVLAIAATGTIGTASASAAAPAQVQKKTLGQGEWFLAPVTPAQDETTTYQRTGWGFWRIFGCVTTVAGFIAGNALVILKVKKAGGILKFAKKIWKAGSAEQKLKVIIATIGYVSGSGALVKACKP